MRELHTLWHLDQRLLLEPLHPLFEEIGTLQDGLRVADYNEVPSRASHTNVQSSKFAEEADLALRKEARSANAHSRETWSLPRHSNERGSR